MREFKLINNLNEELDLMDKAHFFHSPSGLGAIYSQQVQGAGYDFLLLNNTLQQKEISGEIVFFGRDAYAKYQAFADFCAKKPLKLAYKPIDKWFYLDCTVRSLQKTEKNLNTLICPIDFAGLGTWYEKTTAVRVEAQESAGKTYQYKYDYTYEEAARGAVTINNKGNLPAYCKLHILGPCTNPSWALEQDGAVIQRGHVFAAIPAGEKLVVNSSPRELQIAQYTISNAFVKDLYAKSDFDTARFLTVPMGESTISFAHSGSEKIEALVEVNLLASTV